MSNESAKIHYVFMGCALAAYSIIAGVGVFVLERHITEIHSLPGLWIAMAASVGAARFLSMRLLSRQEESIKRLIIDNVTFSYFVVFLFVGILCFA